MHCQQIDIAQPDFATDPDESGYLQALASYYHTRSVKTIMQKLGESGDPGDFTMWLCFTGWLRPFRLQLEQTADE